MNDAELNFLDIAVQYYVAARSAVIAQLVPVCGNFYHHSIEAFLKAKLSQNLSLEEVKKKGGKFGHELPKLWDAFKAEFLSENLSRFDNTIAAIQRFETLRYPDNIIMQGAQLSIEWTQMQPEQPREGGSLPPRYEIVVNDLDNLVAKIFEISSINPAFFTYRLNAYARDAITRDNPIGAQLLKPMS